MLNNIIYATKKKLMLAMILCCKRCKFHTEYKTDNSSTHTLSNNENINE